MKRAFTLIELLVVIAIIAILAAILFPVFAQAKQSAKAAASLSNAKQDNLALLMYAGDNDDYMVLGTAWNTGNDQLCYGGGACFAVWSWTVQPYIKSTGLFMDPLTAPNGQFGTLPKNLTDSYYIQYGYAYSIWAPIMGANTATDPQHPQGISATAAANPAATVMLGGKWANSENISGYDWATGFPPQQGMLAAAAIDVPDCYHIVSWCLDGWGSATFYDGTLLGAKPDAGAYTGGNSLRAANNGIIAFADGHVKKLNVGAMIQGTNYVKTNPSSAMLITDVSKYIWDLL